MMTRSPRLVTPHITNSGVVLDRNRAFIDTANSRFSDLIRRLYDRAGSVTVDVYDLGYKLSIRVAGSSSSGITKMQLFSFDLTLLEQSRENRHPRFLVHDSIVFDGVDPRQISSALTLARETVAQAIRTSSDTRLFQ
jgi:uncharacterized protein YydD (DUF2326 family)